MMSFVFNKWISCHCYWNIAMSQLSFEICHELFGCFNINLMSDTFQTALHQLRFQSLFYSLGTRLALCLEIERNYRKNGYKLLMKRFLGLPVWKSVSDQMIGNGIKNND